MDYQQQMYGRSSYDPARAPHHVHREGGIGGMAMVVGVVVAALAMVIWLAGTQGAADLSTTSPAITDDTAAPTLPTDPAAPGTSETATTPAGN